MSYVLIACRLLVGVVFLVSAITKLRDGRAFAASLADMRLLPPRAVRPVAAVVAVSELAVPFLLGPARTTAIGFGCAVILLVAFSLGIARVLAVGTKASCRCFGVSAEPFGRHHLVRNGVLVAVAVTGLVLAVGAGGGGTEPAGTVAAAGAALILAFLVVAMDELIALFR